MFGKSFQLQHLINTIVNVKPSTVALGTHHYVQMAESDALDCVDPEELKSVVLLFPAGAAVPQSCEGKMMKKFNGREFKYRDIYFKTFLPL